MYKQIGPKNILKNPDMNTDFQTFHTKLRKQ